MTTVLLADDEDAITDNLAPFLRRSGLEVVVARDGEEALRRVATSSPDLLVLDVLMPGLDGREVLRRVRREHADLPIILLTQVGESAERAMALEEGADDYLNKPFDPHELVARIRAVLRRGASGGGPRSPRRTGCAAATSSSTGSRGGSPAPAPRSSSRRARRRCSPTS